MIKNKSLSTLFKSIRKSSWMIRYLPSTIYFNFHYLPFNQAIRLPIWLYKPRLVNCGGSIELRTETVRPGMIEMGRPHVSIYPNNGIMWENRGKFIFAGRTIIGGNSYISTGSNAEVFLGNSFAVYTSLRLVSYHRIIFGNNCLIGWNCLIMDTDLHTITRLDGKHSKGYGEILVGNGVWIASNCKIFKNAVIPDHTVIAGNSVVSKSCSCFQEYSVIGNKQELCVISQGWLDRNNDAVEYE